MSDLLHILSPRSWQQYMLRTVCEVLPVLLLPSARCHVLSPAFLISTFATTFPQPEHRFCAPKVDLLGQLLLFHQPERHSALSREILSLPVHEA